MESGGNKLMNLNDNFCMSTEDYDWYVSGGKRRLGEANTKVALED